jgi:hypothetical protein
MNAFYEHHKDSIRFGYRCFDRILLNGLIQPFQQPERVMGFFATSRQLLSGQPRCAARRRRAVSVLGEGSGRQMERPNCRGAKGPARRIRRRFLQGSQAGSGRRHPKSQRTGTHRDGDRGQEAQPLASTDRRPLGRAIQPLCQRPALGPDLCSHLPVSSVLDPGVLNQHHWLANRMREEGVDFQQCSNAFLRSGRPQRLQELADALTLTAEDLSTCGQKWLACFTPFFTARERKQAGCQHRLFFSQIEYCDNLIFRHRAALDKLGERLLDANRTIGQPNKITVIFGRKVTKQYRGKLQTEGKAPERAVVFRTEKRHSGGSYGRKLVTA